MNEQQPEAKRILPRMRVRMSHAEMCKALDERDIEIHTLHAQVERLQAAGGEVSPGIIARVDAWRSSGESEWAHGVNSGIDAAVQILKSCGQGTPAQEGADTGADERETFLAAERALCLPCDRWNKTQTLIVNEALAKVRAALAARSGQAAVPAMVPMDDMARYDLITNYFSEAWATKKAEGLLDDYTSEFCRINGLTVGGIQASGGAA